MDAFAQLLNGFSVALTPANLLWCLLGTTLGTAIGVLPGLGPALTIALLLPITFGGRNCTRFNTTSGAGAETRSGHGYWAMCR